MNYQAPNGVNIQLKIYYTQNNCDPIIMNTLRLTILPSRLLSYRKFTLDIYGVWRKAR